MCVQSGSNVVTGNGQTQQRQAVANLKLQIDVTVMSVSLQVTNSFRCILQVPAIHRPTAS